MQLLDRLREPSTWAGLAAVVAIYRPELGDALPEIGTALAAAAATIAGAVAMLRRG